MAPSTVQNTSEPVYFFSAREHPHGIFSQWQKCTFTDPDYPDIKFNATEQYMMYRKATTFDDANTAAKILAAKGSGAQKALGREVKGFTDEIWNPVRRRIVKRGNYLKFTQNEKFKKVLLETGDRLLVEASPKDPIWGIGYSAAEAKTIPRKKWGKNYLGKALMKARKKIRAEDAGEEEEDEEDDDSDQEEADDQPKALNSSTTSKRKYDSIIIEDSDDESTPAKKSRIDTTEGENKKEEQPTKDELIEISIKEATETSMIKGSK